MIGTAAAGDRGTGMGRAPGRASGRAPSAAPKRIKNLVPSKDTTKDWSITVALNSGALRAARPPKEVDLRAPWWPPGHQGDTGSCVGWATADGVMRHLLVSAGKIRKDQRLSVRHVWMASKETDEFRSRPETFIEESGTSLKAAADIVRKHGIALDSELPFVVRQTMFLGSIEEFYAACATRKIASYFNARKNLDEWRKALAAGTPILTGLTTDGSFDDGGRRGVLDRVRPTKDDGGHAICVVGYRGDGSFIIRNSWGEGWGDGGFAYATPRYIQARFFDESFVLTL
ncbi:C1 family peptidase [Falsiroseomonas sp. HW251]|uniref:C1 family peptidase n=1 Tax=Falsiroseomonas sp. HW251 TaxID=3390998 RepID=UPI003D313BD3